MDISQIPPRSVLGRNATPYDIARAVYFLVSGLSDYVTGSLVLVEGGLSAAVIRGVRPVAVGRRCGTSAWAVGGRCLHIARQWNAAMSGRGDPLVQRAASM